MESAAGTASIIRVQKWNNPPQGCINNINSTTATANKHTYESKKVCCGIKNNVFIYNTCRKKQTPHNSVNMEFA